MFCEKAMELIRELHRAPEGQLPAFNVRRNRVDWMGVFGGWAGPEGEATFSRYFLAPSLENLLSQRCELQNWEQKFWNMAEQSIGEKKASDLVHFLI